MYLQERETFKKNLFLMCVSTSNRQTLFSTHNSQERLYERRSLRLLVTNSSKTTFEENITLFKQRLRYRGYPDKLLDKTLTEVNFSERFVGPTKQTKNAQKHFAICYGISPFCA